MISNYNSNLAKIKDILQQNLQKISNFESQNIAFLSLPEAVNQEHLDQLLTPCKELLELGGKRWRPLFQILCGQLITQDSCILERAYKLTPLVEFVHTASLIHDDIEDSSDTRRGKPAAYITYGIDRALNAGSWFYFAASCCIETLTECNFNNETELVQLQNKLYKLYTKELRRLHLGQAMDIMWHQNPEIIPTMDEYCSMVKLKTGTLASLAAQTGILSVGGSEKTALELGDIASNIGIGFQIIDDVINVTTGNKGKKRGDDIVEGKKSLPILLHISNHPEDLPFIKECFEKARNEGIESSAIENCITKISESNSIQQAKQKGIEYIENACNKINKMFNNSESCKNIEQLFKSMI